MVGGRYYYDDAYEGAEEKGDLYHIKYLYTKLRFVTTWTIIIQCILYTCVSSRAQ